MDNLTERQKHLLKKYVQNKHNPPEQQHPAPTLHRPSTGLDDLILYTTGNALRILDPHNGHTQTITHENDPIHAATTVPRELFEHYLRGDRR